MVLLSRFTVTITEGCTPLHLTNVHICLLALPFYHSNMAVVVPQSQTAWSTNNLPLPPNWSFTCLEGCLKFCHRGLRITPQFTLTSFIMRKWTKLINNGTTEIEITSPRESTGFFFRQCLIADQRVKKKSQGRM